MKKNIRRKDIGKEEVKSKRGGKSQPGKRESGGVEKFCNGKKDIGK